MHRQWFPLKALIHTGRLCSGGFARQAFPTFIAPIRPSDSLISCHLAMVLPRFGGTRGRARLSSRGLSAQPARRARGTRRARRRLVTGSPLHRFLPRARGGSPRCLGRPLRTRRSRTPRRVHLACPYRFRWCCLQGTVTSGHPRYRAFRGCFTTAHALACLRFAGPVAESVARLATGWCGSTLPGGFRTRWTTLQNFKKSSHPSILS